MTVRVSSTAVERYRGTWSLVCIMAEVVLVAVSMHYLYRTTIYVYKCRLKYVWEEPLLMKRNVFVFHKICNHFVARL